MPGVTAWTGFGFAIRLQVSMYDDELTMGMRTTLLV